MWCGVLRSTYCQASGRDRHRPLAPAGSSRMSWVRVSARVPVRADAPYTHYIAFCWKGHVRAFGDVLCMHITVYLHYLGTVSKCNFKAPPWLTLPKRQSKAVTTLLVLWLVSRTQDRPRDCAVPGVAGWLRVWSNPVAQRRRLGMAGCRSSGDVGVCRHVAGPVLAMANQMQALGRLAYCGHNLPPRQARWATGRYPPLRL